MLSKHLGNKDSVPYTGTTTDKSGLFSCIFINISPPTIQNACMLHKQESSYLAVLYGHGLAI